MAADSVVLGVDIGGTNVRMGLVNSKYQVESFVMAPTCELFAKGANPIAEFVSFMKSYLNANLHGMHLQAISAGFPSTISQDRKVVLQTPNIEMIPDDFNAAEIFNAAFNRPFFVNRDTNNLLFYDMRELDIEKCQNVCGIYFGTGVGNAVMVNGQILSGHNGVASELGHVPVWGNYKICACGNTGCLETIVSGLELQNIRDELFPEIEMRDIFDVGRSNLRIKEFIKGMAQVVALQENLFDPDVVILGGGLLMNGYFPFDYFENEVYRFTRKPLPAQNMKIKYSHPNQINGVIGAAIYAFKRLGNANYL